MPCFGQRGWYAEHSYDYKVEPEGLSFVVRDKTGRERWRTTYEELAIKDALDRLTAGRTWQEKVLLKGNFPNLDYPAGNNGCIDVPSYTILELLGKVTLANGVNKSMIANAHRTGAGDGAVIIEGGSWNGNRDNQTSGNGIDWYWAEEPSSDIIKEGIIFRNMRLRHMYTDGIHENAGSGESIQIMKIHDVSSRDNNGYGLYWRHVSDGEIIGMFPVDKVYLEAGGANRISGLYVNNCLTLASQNGLKLTDTLFDQNSIYFSTPSLTLLGVHYSTFANLDFRMQGNGLTTKPAIQLTASGYPSTNNLFSVIYAGRRGGTGTSRWKYVAEEVAADQDYNIYSSINGADCVSGAIRMLGANSKPTLNNEHTIIGAVVRI